MSTHRDDQVQVLGPCQVLVDGHVMGPSSLQARLLLMLALSPRRAVSMETLEDALWNGAPPASARAALQNQVSRLRRSAGDWVICTVADGYLLGVPTDLDDLRDLVRRGEASLDAEPSATLTMVEAAQRLVRGEPFTELSDTNRVAAVAAVRAEVSELIASAADLTVEACLRLGLTARALPEAARLQAERPHDEQRAVRLVRSLALAGRRGEALTLIAGFRRSLRSDLGLEAGPALDELESELLGDPFAESGPVPDRHREVDQIVAAVHAGRHVHVSGPAGSGISSLLRAVRRELFGTLGVVALASAGGYRDVAAAPLLDLFEELRLTPGQALGPVGSVVPMLTDLAATTPVVLMLDDADLAGPSTRLALREATGIPGVTLVAGTHREDRILADLEALEVDLSAPPDRQATHRTTLADLPEHVYRCLAAAEIAGPRAPVSLLEEADAVDGLSDAIGAGLLRTTAQGELEFCDGGLRDVVRRDTPTGLRVELHHALGRAMARVGVHNGAAQHLLAAFDVEPLAALDQARAAAGLATAAGAHHDAVHWLRSALDQAPGLIPDDLTLTLRIELGDALRLAGDPDHLRVLTEAVELADTGGHSEQLCEALFALLQLGGTTVNAPLDPAQGALIDRAADGVAATPQVAAPMLAAASLAYSLTGNDDLSRALFVRAETAAVDHATRRRVLPFAYMALAHPDDLGTRRRLADELITLGVVHDDRVAEFEGLHLLFPVLVQTGEGEALRAIHARMTELVDQVGDVGRRWSLLYLSAALHHLDHDLDAAQAASASAHTQFSTVSEPRATAVLYGQLFGLSMIRGDTADLAGFLELLVADQPGVPAWNSALALALVDLDPVRAVSLAAEMLDLAQQDATWLVSHLIGGRAVALVTLAGGPCPAYLLARYADTLAPYAGLLSWQGTCSYGPVDTTLALLARARGDERSTEDHVAAALRTARSTSAPAFEADLVNLGLLGG